ncbi:MAG TPA: hypothetical protein VFL27_03885 [Candidatus Dormibacteraeota bacterium]|nr:hypothetical protein [Candidatus Dormibacteraeota bacterium]
MQLKPLYSVRFRYPDGWDAEVTGPGGVEEHDFFFAEGVCTGRISGRFRGANHPRRRTDHTFEMDFQGFIETEDGATVLFDFQGYGRSYPKGRRQVVGAAKHVSDHEKYMWLNDSICVIAGEVRSPQKPPAEIRQGDVELVFDVSELVWEAPPD